MKILSPLNRIDEVEALVGVGADEFYCGIFPADWTYKTISLNRRQERSASFSSFSELAEATSLAHSHKIPVFLTLNEHYYTEEQYPYLFDFVKRALDSNIDALIIADIALLLALRSNGITLPIHISTGGSVYNSACARLYHGLGADRIILPRYLIVDEIRDIVSKAPGIAFETFILNSKCPNEDGLCTFHHGLADLVPQSEEKKYRNACMLRYNVHLWSRSDNVQKTSRIVPEPPFKRQHIWEMTHIDSRPCGACALWDFNNIGIHSLKIVGRGNSASKKVIDISFIRNCFKLLDSTPSRKNYIEQIRSLYQKTYGVTCRCLMCYYPCLNEEWNSQFSYPKLAESSAISPSSRASILEPSSARTSSPAPTN